MRHDIVLAPEAIDDLKRLDAHSRATVKSALETYLRYEPTRTSKSRIKRLRGIRRQGYRLRLDKIRVFYDVSEGVVEVLAVVPKDRAQDWLTAWGRTG
jgi:mRNA interferase RelE/StbE